MDVPRIHEKDLRVLELYSGIGGMHCALAAASVQYDVVAACDINTTANEIYKHNFPNTNLLQLNLDGFSVKDLDKINADLFLISPPCQPFTRVGLQGDEKDKRSKSFLHLLDLMTRLNNLPTYILLENVKGFDVSNTRQLFLDTLARCNYHWQEFLLSPVQFGIPNSRWRYYLIAKLKHLPFCFHSTNEIMESFPVKLSLLQSHFPNCIHEPPSDSLMKGNCEEPVDIPIKTLDFFLESNLKEEYLEQFLIPNKILYKYCMVMDIVRPDEKHSCCFTKAYGHYVEGTGSVLQNNPHISESDSKPIGGKLSLLKSESHSKHSEAKKREAEKRTLEKVKTEVDTFPESSKKAKYDTHRSTGSESTHSLSIKDEPEEVDNDDQVTDADDFAMEMGLACVVCRQLDVQPGNQLVECQECHNLYHQECHRPPTTDQDVNDPRLVWYCTRCTKTFKKLASKTQKNKSSAPPLPKEIAPSKSVKQEAPTLQPFRRAEPKTTLSSSSSSTSSQPLTGLASLAANLSGKVSSLNTKSSVNSKTSSIKSSSMTSSSTGKSSSQLNLITSSSSSFSKAQTSGPVTLQKFGALLSSLTNTTVSGKPSSGYNSNSSNGSSGNSNSSSSSSSSSGSSSKANVSSSTSSSKQNTSNSTSSNSSMMSADKRLQMMKKKAAAKMQEKRRLSK